MYTTIFLLIATLGLLVITQGASIKEEENVFVSKPTSIHDECQHKNRSHLVYQLSNIYPAKTSAGFAFLNAWNTIKDKQLRTNETIGRFQIALKKYCRQTHPPLRKKLDELIRTIRACFQGVEYDSVFRNKKSYALLVNYACDYQDKIREFFTVGGFECFSKKNRELNDCETFVFKEFNKLSSDSPEKLKACEGFEATREYYKCQRRVLKACPILTAKEIIDYYINQLPRQPPCDEITIL